MSRDLSRSMWGVAGVVTRPVVGRWQTLCHSEEPQATWESRRPLCHSEEQRSCDVGVSPSEAYLPCRNLPTEREILTSRSSIAPQNDMAGISSSHIFPNQILHCVKNDTTQGIVSKELCATFSSKGVSSGADMKVARIGCTHRTAYSRQ